MDHDTTTATAADPPAARTLVLTRGTTVSGCSPPGPKDVDRIMHAAYMHGVRATKLRGTYAIGACTLVASDAKTRCIDALGSMPTPSLSPHEIEAIVAEAQQD